MAIFGAGSTWYDEREEQKEEFFNNESYVIGWSYNDAKDVYLAVASLKNGDILYLKSNAPGSKSIRIKGIGIVTQSLTQLFFDKTLNESTQPEDWSIKVKWIIKEEFIIQIPSSEGKLTNVRAATFYEEYLPFVQQEILNKVFAEFNK